MIAQAGHSLVAQRPIHFRVDCRGRSGGSPAVSRAVIPLASILFRNQSGSHHLTTSTFEGVPIVLIKPSSQPRPVGCAASSVRAASKHALRIMDVDPNLVPFREHLEYRYHKYLETKKAISASEGSLNAFSQGFKRFGFNREDGAIVYREWAPAASAAQLIGDFNSWNGWGHQMQKNEYGVWTLRIPDVDGKPAIQHKSRVKIRMQRSGDVWVDRIPAWIKWATVEPGKMGATYDGVYWDPPKRFEFKHAKPPRPAAPRIYEAHVGMSSVEPKVASYLEFAETVLPRVAALGYNTIQLMAVMEHSYYGSFGYHVTNFFAVSSRSGTPDDLKVLVDRAHSLGIRVLLDIVHSHASNNVNDGLNGFDFNQPAADSYFHGGTRGYHSLWDSRCFNYSNWEVQRFLLSNLRWWLDEYHFDGFRFDGVTSMLYLHHGINMSFSGNYNEYFGLNTDVDAVVYMMLANELVHSLDPEATTIAEDVSGMPALCRPTAEGGVGFDYRLGMGIPDKWIEILKHRSDEEWSMGELVHSLTDRRYTEKTIAYAESHDQCMVGDKTIAFWLMDSAMYDGMSALATAPPAVEKGIALHKMIHFLTMALGGEGYLNFIGNEFGHPEWVDFPRQGNEWSHDKCRRRWDLADADHLRYKFMQAFDAAMQSLDEQYHFLAAPHQLVSCASEEEKTIVFERGDLVFLFNFHASNSYDGYKVGCDMPGKYRVVLDTDDPRFGGHGRVDPTVDHFTTPEGEPGKRETNFNDRPNSFLTGAPPRTAQVYARVQEPVTSPKGGRHKVPRPKS